jgi:CRP/FNR family transcriptional regulator, cyclic AMP receptor protein
MDKAVLAQLLRKLRFSADFPEEMLQRLAAAAVVRRFLPHDVLFREKAENDQLMIVCTGRVALEITVPGHGTVRLLTLGPGELVAWSSLFGGRTTTSAVATEETRLISISASQLLATCDADHTFGYSLMRRLADALAARLTDTRMKLVDLLTFDQAIGLQPEKRH